MIPVLRIAIIEAGWALSKVGKGDCREEFSLLIADSFSFFSMILSNRFMWNFKCIDYRLFRLFAITGILRILAWGKLEISRLILIFFFFSGTALAPLGRGGRLKFLGYRCELGACLINKLL